DRAAGPVAALRQGRCAGRDGARRRRAAGPGAVGAAVRARRHSRALGRRLSPRARALGGRTLRRGRSRDAALRGAGGADAAAARRGGDGAAATVSPRLARVLTAISTPFGHCNPDRTPPPHFRGAPPCPTARAVALARYNDRVGQDTTSQAESPGDPT